MSPEAPDVPLADFGVYPIDSLKPGAWASLWEVHVAARHLDGPILVFSERMALQVCNRAGRAGPSLCCIITAEAHHELLEGPVPSDALAVHGEERLQRWLP